MPFLIIPYVEHQVGAGAIRTGIRAVSRCGSSTMIWLLEAPAPQHCHRSHWRQRQSRSPWSWSHRSQSRWSWSQRQAFGAKDVGAGPHRIAAIPQLFGSLCLVGAGAIGAKAGALGKPSEPKTSESDLHCIATPPQWFSSLRLRLPNTAIGVVKARELGARALGAGAKPSEPEPYCVTAPPQWFGSLRLHLRIAKLINCDPKVTFDNWTKYSWKYATLWTNEEKRRDG
jgi:hypothetical protein